MRARIEVRVASLHPDLHAALLEDWSVDSWDTPPRPLVVPGRALGRALVRDAARRHGAAFNTAVYTFTDLAAHLTAAQGARRRRLRVEAATWLVRELRHRRARAATTFDAALEIAGFRAALRRAFDDLAHAGLIARRDVERTLVRHGLDLPLASRHVLELLHAYRAAFEVTHDDRVALLARAASLPPGSLCTALGAEELWIHGFAALDAAETRFVDRLCDEPDLRLHLFIPRSSDGDDDPPLAVHLARRADVTTERRPPRGRRGPDDLRFIAAPSPEAEADEVARALLQAAADGFGFDTMAVMALHAAAIDGIATSLRRAGIPHRYQPGAPLAGTRAARALLALFDVASRGLRPEPVLSFLATAPLQWREWAGIESDPVPSGWERVARDAFVGAGSRDWNAKLTRLATEQEAVAAELEQESAPATHARATAAAARELVRVVAALEALLRSLPARASWNEWVEAVVRVLHAAFAPSAERDALAGAVERLRALDGLGRTQPLRADFREALRGVLAGATVPASRDLVAAVQLGSAPSLWGAPFDLVCLVAAGEGEWPSQRHEDGVLGDRDWRALRAIVPDPAAMPSAATRLERERRWFHDGCDAARRRLVVSWARLDPSTGAARLPSALVLDLASQRSGRRLDYEALMQSPQVARVPLRRSGVDAGVPALHRAEFDAWIAAALPPPAARRWVASLDVPASRGVALERLRARARFTAADGWLDGPEVRAALAARMRGANMSATQLATYATCPFRYFWRYLLRVEPLDRGDRRDLDTLESGRLAHHVLEHLHRDAAAAGVTVNELDDATLDVRLDAAIDAASAALDARGRSGSRLLWEVRRRRLQDDLGRYLRAERDHAAAWSVHDLELGFGRSFELAPSIETAHGRVWLRGTIDRIDTRGASAALRIVDYKTGRRLNPNERDPRAVQLVVYLWVATGGDAARLRDSEGVFAHVTRRGAFAWQRLPGAALAGGELEAHVAGVVGGIARGELFAHPGAAAAHCRSCDYVRACEARVGALSQRKAAAGQTVTFASLPEFASRLRTDAAEVSPS